MLDFLFSISSSMVLDHAIIPKLEDGPHANLSSLLLPHPTSIYTCQNF